MATHWAQENAGPDSSSRARRRVLAPLGAALVSACVTGGCDERGVEERFVEKGIERLPESAERAAGETASGEAWTVPEAWTIPEGWERDEAPRPMRLATFLAPDPGGPVEVAVTRFGGRVGGELANVNRWRGQMGLAPISGDQLAPNLRRFSSPGFEGYAVRIEGGDSVLLVAGVYEAAQDRTWFVRAAAAPPAADRLEGEVFAFARSIAVTDPAGGG